MEMTGVMEDSFGFKEHNLRKETQLHLDTATYQPLKLTSSLDG